MKNLLLTGLLLALLVPGALAQIQVKGKVTDPAENAPLPGVNIIVKGTSTGTTTDFEGGYTLEVPDENAVLLFSFIGYVTQEIPVSGRSVIDVQLSQDVQQLGEVVVTALGIEKDEESLTYATQEIGGEELTTVKQQNLVNNLAGKTAGITITKSAGGVGASSRVLLRGNKSISGENQPLYVIDGVPMNNANLGSTSDLYGTVDNGDAIANLNPEDIESINVLKGASAAALYGSQAANGVILITTKKGKSGVSTVSFSSSLTFENALKTPELQSQYGQTTPGASLDTWGEKNNTASTEHVDEFFNTGSTFINSVSVNSGTENAQYYVSYARTDAKGIVPENEMEKNNFMVRLTGKIFDNVKVDASANFVNQKIDNTPLAGFYHNPVLSTYIFPESSDRFNYYKNNLYTYDDRRALYVENYPYKDLNNYPFPGENPYWVVRNQTNTSWRNRGIYKLGLTVPVGEHIKIMGRMNLDRVEDKFKHKLSAGSSIINVDSSGDYQYRTQVATQLYSDLLATYSNKLSDAVSLDATVGFINTYKQTEMLNIQSTGIQGGLFIPNLFAIQNFTTNVRKEENEQETLLQAGFATATIGINNMIYADVTLRNEWSSTLPVSDNSFFYPSGGLSFILTEVIGESQFLNYAKLRTSYSEVGNSLPYGIAFAQPRTIDYNGTLKFPEAGPLGNLKPERVKSFELGAKFNMLDSKLNLDVTFYNNTVEDQFFTIPAATGDAYENYYLNGGTIRNRGIEAMLGYNLLSGGGLKYTSSFNFSTNRNKIVEITDLLGDGTFVITQAADTRIIQITATQGGRYGDFYGRDFQRDENGDIIVQDGNVLASDLKYMGNPNPKWQLGWQNAFSYKNWDFKFLIDGKFGGKVVGQTEAYLDVLGRSKATADARNAGGVVVSGETIPAEAYYTRVGGTDAIATPYVYDATNVRLREVSLSYNFPSAMLGNAIKSLRLSAVGRNLFFIKNDAPFDPEVSAGSGNGFQGLNTFLVPSTRSYGVSLNATF